MVFAVYGLYQKATMPPTFDRESPYPVLYREALLFEGELP